MTIQEAVASILGEDFAASLITEMGLRWAIVAAMAKAKKSDDPEAIATIRDWNAANRA